MVTASHASCGCSAPKKKKVSCCRKKSGYVCGFQETPHAAVPRVTTALTRQDIFGAIGARLTFNRMDYKVEPGLYAAGNPTPDSVVLASANYKLSFDTLRSCLGALDVWILVLDTKGINVWCAAGKGTFGTQEMINRIKLTGLEKIVSARTIVAPQLGAPGVAAHLVARESGFKVVYGPVRAKDVPVFLKSNMQATADMRKVHFSFVDRLILVPAEVAFLFPNGLYCLAAAFFLSGLGKNGYSLPLMISDGMIAVRNLILAFISGAVLGPLFLPWLPGRGFSGKGACAGAVVSLVLFACAGPASGWLNSAGWFLVMTAISSFVTMNFTGASTFTSLSGVKREMRIAVPLQAILCAAGVILLVMTRFR